MPATRSLEGQTLRRIPSPMTSRSLLFSLAIALALTTQGVAAPPIRHRLIVAEYGKGGNRLLELDADGKPVWEYKPPSTMVIFEVLPNGNLLFGYGGKPTGVREITGRGDEVFNYVSPSVQVFGCSRLANGNTLVAEQNPCQAVEVNARGEVIHVTPLQTSYKPFHQQVRAIHQLPNGHILASHEGEGAVRQVDQTGKTVWEYTGIPMVGDAQRLANGNTLIACGRQKRIIEVTPDKRIVWEFGSNDAPELNLTWIFSLQRLKNGNLIVGNFLRGQEGKGAHVFEVTPDKKVVWTWADHTLVKSLTTVRVIGE